MQKNTNSIAKVAAIVAASALVAMSFAAAIPAAHAQTTTTTTTLTSSQVAALEAQIASLQAQLSAATGGSSASVTFSRDLTIGSTGADVTALQTWLIAKGYSIPAGATGYFGTETRAAVAAYQSANGITPAVGYFGPITRAKVNAAGGTTTTTTTTTTGGSTTLTGGEGSVNNFQTIGASTTILGQGSNQNVYGFSFVAGGSDLNVDRINYEVVLSSDNTVTAASIHPWNVFQTATLTDSSGNTIATVDASNQNNWSQEGTGGYQGDTQIYQLTFTGLNQVVKEGSTQTYYLKLSTQPVLASANNGARYAVSLEGQGLRATDALGLQEYSPNSTSSNDVLVQATSSGTASISTGSDNPTVTTIMGNSTNPTNNVVLNTFTIAANGGENVELYSLPVVASTSQAYVSTLIQSLSLYQGSTLLDTVSPAATTSDYAVVNFNNVNLNIPQGTTDSFSIQGNISPIDGITVPNGASVAVSIPNGTPTGGAAYLGAVTPNIEDASGNNVNVTGASTGNAIAFASTGVSVGTPTTSATVQNNGGNVTGQTGTFTFTFNVTAFGQTVYISSTSAAYSVTMHDATTGTSSSTLASAISSNATRSSHGNYMVSNGQTQSFTVTATEATSAGNFFYATLNSLNFGTVDSETGVTASSTPLPSTFTTSAVAINS